MPARGTEGSFPVASLPTRSTWRLTCTLQSRGKAVPAHCAETFFTRKFVAFTTHSLWSQERQRNLLYTTTTRRRNSTPQAHHRKRFTAMELSPLGRLPAEIRLEIYQHVLTVDGSLHLKAEKIHPHAGAHGRWRWAVSWRLDSFRDFALPKHMLAITLTCPQLRLEAWPIYFATNKWTITPRHMNGLRD